MNKTRISLSLFFALLLFSFPVWATTGDPNNSPTPGPPIGISEEIQKKLDDMQNQITTLDNIVSDLKDDTGNGSASYQLYRNIDKIIMAAAAITMLFIASLIFLFITVKKLRRDIKKLHNEPSQLDILKQDIDDKLKSLEGRIPYAGGSPDVQYVKQSDIESMRSKILEIEDKVYVFESNFNRLTSEQAKSKKEQQDIKKGKLDPLTVFNRWAADPTASRLPEPFYYINGEPRIRTNQQFSESSVPAKWIRNRHGSTNYLLPNPAFFDQMTDISNLYKMDLNALKSKGQNRIEVINACEISDAGFIEFPGELRII